ncbi:MAG: FG-GAP-like repeat-containing protein [Planctomycetota bacterium]
MRSLALVVAFAAPGFAQQLLITRFGTQPNAQTGDRVVAAGGDLDGDSIPDFLVGSPTWGMGRVQVISGSTWVTRTLIGTSPNGFGNAVLLCSPDMNNDGVRDIVLNRGADLVAYSGATLALLWQTPAIGFAAFESAAALGDIDNDGRGDLAATLYLGSGNYVLWTLRGLNGQQLQVGAGLNGSTRALVSLGDTNGDGRPEIARAQANANIEIYQTPPLPGLFSVSIATTELAVANLVGSPLLELLAPSAGVLNVLSATNGAVLRTYPAPYTDDFAVVGDLNADGVPDLALREQTGAPGEAVVFRSGSNGAVLSRWLGIPGFTCTELAGIGDVNGDGYPDLLIGDRGASAQPLSGITTGGWQVVSGRIVATMSSKPVNCYQGPFPPLLGITRPVLGQLALIEGREAPFGTVGFLGFSPQPTFPTSLGVVGCDAWFDPTNGLLLYQSTGSSWGFYFPVPLAPQLAGYAFALQAFYAPTFSPIGIDLTNGVWGRFGF